MKDQFEHSDTEPTAADWQSDASARQLHDIKASLAISSGFSQALESALSGLQETYLGIVHSVDDEVPAEQLDKLRGHENDYKFCLSRLTSSLEQLKTRIDDFPPLIENTSSSSKEDAA